MQIGIRCLGMHRRGLRAAIPASEARPHANAAARNEPGLVFMAPAADVGGFVSPAAVARTFIGLACPRLTCFQYKIRSEFTSSINSFVLGPAVIYTQSSIELNKRAASNKHTPAA
jgi:hypothetical protein